ncbi:unnamed protein product [Linum trigynum]|uniref:GPI-anchored wall transfer protein n=1 Tax=Linum trigynum TaxID=586398 RepID=A0AAV2GHK3_9ROSI
MDPVSNSFNPHKLLKEEFVSNLNGSSMLEIASLSTIVPALFLLRRAFCFSYKSDATKKDDDAVAKSRNLGAYLAVVSLDFLFLIVPTLLVLTVLADWVHVLAIVLVVLILSLAAKRFASFASNSGSASQLRTNISSYRVNVMIVTCLCILAVDFTIFPRRYAKTETYGTSLMDLGVGSFIVTNSLVSRQARGISSMSWKAAFKSSSPLLVLGFGRLLSTRSVDYQVHVAEYGVHWNFFFTLAAVTILTSIIKIPPKYSGLFGLSLLVGYQWLSVNGLNLYLLSNERGTDLLSQNKEGLFSILGYWGIYLLGVQLGYHLFFGDHKPELKSKKWATIKVSCLSIIFWLTTVVLDSHVERASRRMCNLAYATLVLAQNLQVLAILMLSDCIGVSSISTLEEAINRNLLGTFLVANVLTGLTNMLVDTIFSTPLSALSILVTYAYLLSIITGIADFYGMRIKFW